MTDTNKEFDALVFIARAQPFHRGHKAVIDQALKRAKHVVVVVGSSFAARNIRNPFTFEERKAMILSAYTTCSDIHPDRIKVVPVSDYPYDDTKWVSAIQRVVDQAVPDAKNVGLIGHSKDSTSYYLDIFPQWNGHVEVPNVNDINATDIRKLMFEPSTGNAERIQALMGDVPYATMCKCISAIGQLNGPWDTLYQEYQMVKKYKEAWKVAPFPPTFMTVDAVVVQSGHILLVERGDMPGKGLWALPGGFLNQEETMLDGALRELKEETRIKVPPQILKDRVKNSKTFDAPNRSTRGRTITQAFYIDLGVGELPKVKGSDDAKKAWWEPIGNLKQEVFFEDHFAIIDHFLGFAQ